MLFCNHDPVLGDFSRDPRCSRCGEEVCDFLYDLEGAWLCEDCFDLICLELKRRARHDAFDLAEALREPPRDFEEGTGSGVTTRTGSDASVLEAADQRPGEDPGGALQ